MNKNLKEDLSKIFTIMLITLFGRNLLIFKEKEKSKIGFATIKSK